jgi:ubiquinone/menaquinone biosynthesis C-methylase UbiE
MSRELYGESYWEGTERQVRSSTDPITKLKWKVAAHYLKTELLLRGKNGYNRHLDIGGGPGLLASNFHPERVYNLDLSEYALSQSKAKYNVAGKIEAIPFADNSFDLITCIDVLEHIPLPQLPAALDEIKRVMTDDGMAIAIPSTLDDEIIHKDPTHVTKESPAFWKELFIENGFKIHDIPLTKLARAFGHLQLRKLVPQLPVIPTIPTLRTGLFILEKNKIEN